MNKQNILGIKCQPLPTQGCRAPEEPMCLNISYSHKKPLNLESDPNPIPNPNFVW